MRASDELEVVLPTLKLAFATARRLSDFRSTARRRLPLGWSLNEIDPYDGSDQLLVLCDADLNGMGFLVSEDEDAMEMHAVIDEELVLLGRRWAGGPAVIPRAA